MLGVTCVDGENGEGTSQEVGGVRSGRWGGDATHLRQAKQPQQRPGPWWQQNTSATGCLHLACTSARRLLPHAACPSPALPPHPSPAQQQLLTCPRGSQCRWVRTSCVRRPRSSPRPATEHPRACLALQAGSRRRGPEAVQARVCCYPQVDYCSAAQLLCCSAALLLCCSAAQLLCCSAALLLMLNQTESRQMNHAQFIPQTCSSNRSHAGSLCPLHCSCMAAHHQLPAHTKLQNDGL